MAIELELDFKEAVIGNTVHVLAARELIRDLEEGTSHLHVPYPACYTPGLQTHLDANTTSIVMGYLQDEKQVWPAVPNPEVVKQEIERVGVEFQVASSQTSFVAVEERDESEKVREAETRVVPSLASQQADKQAERAQSQADSVFEAVPPNISF